MLKFKLECYTISLSSILQMRHGLLKKEREKDSMPKKHDPKKMDTSMSMKKKKEKIYCWRLPTSPSDDARRCQFGTAVFHEQRIDPQAHGIPL